MYDHIHEYGSADLHDGAEHDMGIAQVAGHRGKGFYPQSSFFRVQDLSEGEGVTVPTHAVCICFNFYHFFVRQDDIEANTNNGGSTSCSSTH